MTTFDAESDALIRELIIPGSGDNNFRPMVVTQPFIDPPDSFRARTVSDMYFITPERTKFSIFEFDVGLDPKIEPIIFSIQNRCLNTTLRVNLTIPPFLRSNLGTEFLVPEIGDDTLTPIATDAPFSVGSGKGLVNVTLTFSEAQAKTLNPDIYTDKIIFDIFPNDVLTGPIFVSTIIGAPRDLNGREEEFPVDDDTPITETPVEPVNTIITETVEVEVPVPVLSPGFTAGVDGVTNDGIPFTAGNVVEGPAPAGWTTEADGRSYPPIIPDKVCDPITGLGPDGIALEDIPEDELTPLQRLLLDSKSIPPSFGSQTLRRGFIIEPELFLEGSNAFRATRLTPELVVADSVPGRTEFKIINHSDKLRTGVLTTLDPLFDVFKLTVDDQTAVVKEGQRIPFSFVDPIGNSISRNLEKILDEGEKLEVPNDARGTEELQFSRIIGTAASILFNLRNEGVGQPV